MNKVFYCRDRVINLDKPIIMGILNVTPDSFFDGGQYSRVDAAIAQADKMLAQGATILDIGAESTRPGSKPVCAFEQIERLRPIIDAVVKKSQALPYKNPFRVYRCNLCNSQVKYIGKVNG